MGGRVEMALKSMVSWHRIYEGLLERWGEVEGYQLLSQIGEGCR